MKIKTDSELAVDFLNHYIEATVEDVARNMEWKDTETEDHKIITAAEAKEEFKKNFRESILNKKENERNERGYNLIMQHLGEYPNDRLCLKELEQVTQKYEASIKEMMDKNIDKINGILHADIDFNNLVQTLKKLPPPTSEGDADNFFSPIGGKFKLSHDTLTTFYQIGTKLYNEDQVEDAICVFSYLSALDDLNYEIWVSLGMSYQRAKEWKPALKAYTMANLVNPHNPIPYFYSIDCYLAINSKPDAETALKMGKHFISDENREQMAQLVNLYENLILQKQ
jgi:tetratricopeptide (TPR) repeat protein